MRSQRIVVVLLGLIIASGVLPPQISAQTGAIIPLIEGWNLISVPVAVASPDECFAPIAASCESVWAYDPQAQDGPWLRYSPHAPAYANTLSEVNATMGLWVDMAQADTLVVDIETEAMTVDLVKGWNLIGHALQSERLLVNVLNEIAGTYSLVQGYDGTAPDDPWRMYDPAAGSDASDLHLFSANAGYWILATEACTLNLAPVLPSSTDWIGYVNYYRDMACVPYVAENATWSQGDWLHARYEVKNDHIGHTESVGNPWYTAEGLAAAQSSNIFCSSTTQLVHQDAIDKWMVGPFHAVGLIDPQLGQVGFGLYTEADGGYQSAACLDVIRGLDYEQSCHYPVMWPAQGMTVGLTSYWGGESPDPLVSCPGYMPPVGLPIILQLGPGSVTPNVTSSSLIADAQCLDHHVFDETNYSNPDSSAQALGRAVLGARDAVVLVPREPLERGQTYTASISADGETYVWSFHVDESASLSGAIAGSAPTMKVGTPPVAIPFR